jgi:hypothetical protein
LKTLKEKTVGGKEDERRRGERKLEASPFLRF